MTCNIQKSLLDLPSMSLIMKTFDPNISCSCSRIMRAVGFWPILALIGTINWHGFSKLPGSLEFFRGWFSAILHINLYGSDRNLETVRASSARGMSYKKTSSPGCIRSVGFFFWWLDLFLTRFFCMAFALDQ